MQYVMDLIQTEDQQKTEKVWEAICRFFSHQPGFVSGKLLETMQTLHPKADYKLTSVCCWENDDAWQAARQAVVSDPKMAALLPALAGQFTSFKGKLDQGGRHDTAVDGGSERHMMLVDVIYLEENRMAAYAEMWHRARTYMQDKPGYVGARLYRTREPDNAIKFINLAEWTSTETFFESLDTPEFLSIIDDFKDDFSLFLSVVKKSIEPAAMATETAGA